MKYKTRVCQACNGAGKFVAAIYNGGMTSGMVDPCPVCKGKGVTNTKPPAKHEQEYQKD